MLDLSIKRDAQIYNVTTLRVKAALRKEVNQLVKANKYRQHYRFIDYAIHLIYDDVVLGYILDVMVIKNQSIDSVSLEGFNSYITEYNARFDNLPKNQTFLIDSIDRSSLRKHFMTLALQLEPAIKKEKTRIKKMMKG